MVVDAIAIIIGLVIWYFYYGLECYLNGSTLIFLCLWQEITWILPGGRKRKGRFVRNEIICYEEGKELYDGSICASNNGTWRHKAVVEGDLYEQCGEDILPGWKHFLCVHVLIPLMPLIIVVLYSKSA